MNTVRMLAHAVGQGMVVPAVVGTGTTVLVLLARPFELPLTIVVAVLGLLVLGWLCATNA